MIIQSYDRKAERESTRELWLAIAGLFCVMGICWACFVVLWAATPSAWW